MPYTRSQMTEKTLNNCFLLHVHKDIVSITKDYLFKILMNVSYTLVIFNFDLMTDVLYTSIMPRYVEVNYFVTPRPCPPTF